MELLYVVLGLLILYLCKNVFVVEGITATPTPTPNQCNSGVCTPVDGEIRCINDPSCKTDPGIGCNAGGIATECRFCSDDERSDFVKCNSNIPCRCVVNTLGFPINSSNNNSCDEFCKEQLETNPLDSSFYGSCGEFTIMGGQVKVCNCYKKINGRDCSKTCTERGSAKCDANYTR